ncbi:MAG: glycosyltransferase family 4 protein [Patescibacteria group bacterium]
MSPLLKIAIVTPFGAEERLDHFADFLLAQGLIRKGYDLRFYTYRIRSNPEYRDGTYKGVRVYRCSQVKGFSPRLVWQLLCFRPNVVILCHIRSLLNFVASIAARLVGAKVIFQVVGVLHDPYIVADRDNPIGTMYSENRIITRFPQFLSCLFNPKKHGSCWENYAYHAPLAQADVRVNIMNFEHDMLKKATGLESLVIPWGIPLRKEVEERVPDPQRNTSLPESFLFYIGQVKKRKGWDTIIESLALLKQEGIRKNLVFVTSSSPEEFKEAEDLVTQRGLADQVWVLFRISNEEKAWFYKRAEATLAPSRYEAFGLTLFESFAAGTPVLGTDIPVYSDFLFDGETGMVSKKGDPSTLAENIKRLADPELRKKLVDGGYRIVQKFTDGRMVDSFDRLIQDILSPRSN